MMNGFFIGLGVALLLWFAAFLFLKAFVRGRTSPDFILGLLQEEVRELEADIDEKTEQNLELLEEKIHVLRDMCAEAERRIAVLTHEFENRERESQTFAALEKKPLVERLVVRDEPRGQSRLVEPPSGREPKPLAKPAKQKRIEASLTELKPAKPEKAGPEKPVAEVSGAAKPINITRSGEPLVIKPRPLGERITELKEAGFSPELIAKRLDINVGEVELYFRFAEK